MVGGYKEAATDDQPSLVQGDRNRSLLGRSGARTAARADAIPWSEENTEAFAGLHNKGRRFDEASAISDKIWEVSEGALTDEDTEIVWLAFGNPTRNPGRFRDCFVRSPPWRRSRSTHR
jgi:hypothetical protein